ncbi:methyltransferase domain-containing protein [Embleya sp. NBC_00896]|uniref:class I SAM-dependent methyltransferase n=1 Tax=Embleya sp. NBC_00896 TaxID=2975961 RepID=UPI002F917FEA
MDQERRFDTWAAGDAYERYMGRWSRPVAERFVAWLGCGAGSRWVDVGCGTGALTATVVGRCRPRTVVGVDRSAGFVARARATAPTPACYVVADALALPLRDATCDAAVSGLVLNFFPAPGAALAGTPTAAALTGLYTVAFGASHPLAKKIGAWPSVFAVAGTVAAASYTLADRKA